MAVMTEIDYLNMLERLFGRIAVELGVRVTRYSFGKFEQREYRSGDLTYDLDSSFQVEICRWYDSINHTSERVVSPIPIVTEEEEAEFEPVLKEAAQKLVEEQPPSYA